MKKPCLNMIVRNEAAIIEKCLRSVAPHVSHYVIMDTGSTDDTKAIIARVMDEFGVTGVVIDGEFKTFGQARNDALRHCRASEYDFEHILLVDADMELVVRSQNPWEILGIYDGQIIQKASGIEYWNLRVTRKDGQGWYQGSTHEYIDSPVGHMTMPGLFFIDHACGSSRGEKYERDTRLLLADLEADPKNVRAMYYLARTYLEMGRLEEALKYFDMRAAAGGWHEEVWHSTLLGAECQLRAGAKDDYVLRLLRAYDLRPTRAETLTRLAGHHQDEKRHDLAMLFAQQAMAMPYPKGDSLFIELECYTWKPKMIASISGFYCQSHANKKAGAQACAALTAPVREQPAWLTTIAHNNYVFYCPTLLKKFGLEPKRFDTIYGIDSKWTPSNPSIVATSLGYEVCIRHVNYRITQEGQYVMPPGENVQTINYIANWASTTGASYNIRKLRGAPLPTDVNIQGLEDVRLYHSGGQLWGSATHETPEHRLQLCRFKIEDSGEISEFWAMPSPVGKGVEKNWMPITGGDDGSHRWVYEVSPRTLLYTAGQGIIGQPVPCGIKNPDIRGGSQIVPVGKTGTHLAVVHEVVYDNPVRQRRAYLHRFLLLDSEYRTVGVSDPWAFETAGDIEFCAGLAVSAGLQEVVLTYGVLDSQAAYMVLKLPDVMAMIHGV